MGVQQFGKLLREKAPHILATHQDSEKYINKVIAFDAPMQIYKAVYGTRLNMYDNITTNDGKIASHVYVIFCKMVSIVQSGVIPLFVFDGPSPELKNYTLEKRRNEKRSKGNKSGTSDIINLDNNSFTINKQHIDDIKKLLTLMGIPFINSPTEAEACCATMCKKGFAYGTVTDDWDSLLFGSPITLKNFKISSNKTNTICEIKLDQVLESLNLSHSELIDLCSILGTDYCQGIKMNPIDAYDKFMENEKDINKFIENINKPLPENFLENLRKGKEFYYDNPSTDMNFKDIKLQPPNKTKLIKYLVETFNLDKYCKKNKLIYKINQLVFMHDKYIKNNKLNIFDYNEFCETMKYKYKPGHNLIQKSEIKLCINGKQLSDLCNFHFNDLINI